MLTGVRVEINDNRLTMVATDRFRLAMRDFAWEPSTEVEDTAVLVHRTRQQDNRKDRT